MAGLEVFFSYSHKDESLRDELATHLKLLQRQGIISAWHDRGIPAGAEWDRQINYHLQRARIILLLVSADFLASDYCWDMEVNQAMQRHEAGEATVIPIILRPCDWTSTPFGKLQTLPKDARPITTWENKDEAFSEIARVIREITVGVTENPR